MYFIGLDVHKKTISYCVKDAAGRVHQEGKIGSLIHAMRALRARRRPRVFPLDKDLHGGRQSGNCGFCMRKYCYGAPTFSPGSDQWLTGMGSRMGLPRLGQLKA